MFVLLRYSGTLLSLKIYLTSFQTGSLTIIQNLWKNLAWRPFGLGALNAFKDQAHAWFLHPKPGCISWDYLPQKGQLATLRVGDRGLCQAWSEKLHKIPSDIVHRSIFTQNPFPHLIFKTRNPVSLSSHNGGHVMKSRVSVTFHKVSDARFLHPQLLFLV